MNMMKNYKKKYENVFTSDKSLNKCKINKVSTDNDMDVNAYCELLNNSCRKFEVDLFNNFVKVNWLMRRFCYKGMPRQKTRWNGFALDSAFGVFMHKYINVEHKIVTRNFIFPRLATYFEDFFPGFDARDPFKEKMEYPYKHITLAFLLLIHRMPERVELLEYAEKKKMKYIEFLDFIINYISCYNDEIGRDHYFFGTSHAFMPDIRIHKKNYEYRTKT